VFPGRKKKKKKNGSSTVEGRGELIKRSGRAKLAFNSLGVTVARKRNNKPKKEERVGKWR